MAGSTVQQDQASGGGVVAGDPALQSGTPSPTPPSVKVFARPIRHPSEGWGLLRLLRHTKIPAFAGMTDYGTAD